LLETRLREQERTCKGGALAPPPFCGANVSLLPGLPGGSITDKDAQESPFSAAALPTPYEVVFPAKGTNLWDKPPVKIPLIKIREAIAKAPRTAATMDDEDFLAGFVNPRYLMNSHFQITSSGTVTVHIAGPTENSLYNFLSDYIRDWNQYVYAEAVLVAAVKFAPLPGASKEARARTAIGATSTILTSSMRQIVDSARVHGVETTHAAALRWAMDLFLNRFCYSPNTGFNVADYANPVRQAILHNAATAAQQAAEAAALAGKSPPGKDWKPLRSG
jgi:hypothetical protein